MSPRSSRHISSKGRGEKPQSGRIEAIIFAMPRRSGILLHPTCLPGPFGTGDLGPEAERFLDWLAAAGQTLWQMLPLGPHGPAGSPYDTWSAFAGNPLLVSPESLMQNGLATPDEVEQARFAPGPVDFAAAASVKQRLLRKAWQAFASGLGCSDLRTRLEQLGDDAETSGWLGDWCLFAALKERLDDAPWLEWPRDLRQREPRALAAARRELAQEIAYHRFAQLLFLDQWSSLRRRAERLGIELFGDLAIYVALDSADVWTHSDLFDLDESGRPNAVSGVPPDYFSATGQLWGNPLYRWRRVAETGYRWWIERIRWSLGLFDLLRIDHFRGFVGYWEVPAGASAASEGRWRVGPGRALFDAIGSELGDARIVAEDLGVITEDVRELRRELGIPGMKVLQFGFGDPRSEHLPHRLDRNTVIYTGTHDNDTARGWFGAADETVRGHARLYLGGSAEEIHWSLVRAALTSVADTAVLPLQDVLGLGPEARMNRPGEASGQWAWRLTARPDADTAQRLRRLTEAAGRHLPTLEPPPDPEPRQ
jgi:4-alpha-glucanotransferase